MQSGDLTNLQNNRAALTRYRKLLEDNADNDKNFFSILPLATAQLDNKEVNLKLKGHVGSAIYINEWAKVILLLNEKLARYFGNSNTRFPKLTPEDSTQIDLILEFCDRFYQTTRRRTHSVFVHEIVNLLKSEDWDTTIKVLKIMSDHSTRIKKTCPALQEITIVEALINLSHAQNFMGCQRTSYLDMLSSSPKEMIFHFYPINEASIVEGATISERSIDLSHLCGNEKSSYELTEDLQKKYGISSDFTLTLWYNIRMARIPSEDKTTRYKMILAAILAYNIFINETSNRSALESFINETKLITHLLSELIQLQKFPGTKLDMHMAIMDVLTSLINPDGNFHRIMSHNINELHNTLLRHFGINANGTGLLQSMLRECTSIDVIKDIGEKYRIVFPQGSLKILPIETASEQKFLANLMNFTTAIFRNLSKRELSNQDSIRFWRDIQIILISMLQLPKDDHCYLYRVPVTILSNQLLFMLSLKKNIEYDASNANTIINRLYFELRKIKSKESELVYPGQGNPCLEYRQELCKSLMKLISSSVTMSLTRSLALAEMDGVLDEELIRNNNIPSYFREDNGISMEQQLQNRMGMIAQWADRFELGRPQGEEVKVDAVAPQGDTVALSRRIVESKLIEFFKDMFEDLVKNNKKAYSTYGSIACSALMLISVVIKDIPSCMPSMKSCGIVSNVLGYLAKHMIPEENCFCIALYTLASFMLHETGAEMVTNMRVMSNVLKMLTSSNYPNCIADRREVFKECADHILFINGQSVADTKSEIIRSFENLLITLNKNGNTVISGLGRESTGQLTEVSKTNCKKYLQSVRNVMKLLCNLTEKAISREHKKFLLALNKNNECIKITINLERIQGILIEECDDDDSINKDESYIAIIAKFYLSDYFRDRNSGLSSQDCIFNVLMGLAEKLDKTLGLSCSTENPLGDFALGKRKINISLDDLVMAFPESRRLKIVFSTIMWICKSVVIFSHNCPNGFEKLLKFIIKFHYLVIKEIVRLMCLNETITSKEFKKLLNDVTNDIKINESNEDMNKISFFMLGMGKSAYEKSIYMLYDAVQSSLPNLMISFMKKSRMYFMEERAENTHIAQLVGKCAAELIAESCNNSAISLIVKASSKEDTTARILSTTFIIKDTAKLLLYKYLKFAEIFEFCKAGGFGYLHKLYQEIILQMISKPLSPDNELLKFSLTHLIKIYATIINPTQLRVLSSRAPVSDSELREQGFDTPENFGSSVLAYIIEGIFKANYGEYKKAVRFLAEYAPEAFIILFGVIEKYTRKNTLAELFNDSRPGFSFDRFMEWHPRDSTILPVLTQRLVSLGYDQVNSENALRRSRMNLELALLDLSNQSNEQKSSNGTGRSRTEDIIMTNSGIRKVEAKHIHKEVIIWFDWILTALYEGLYSISSYKCKYLLYSLSEFLAASGLYKVRSGFAFLLNELQTLLFSIEYNYALELIPTDEFPSCDLVEASMTGKLRKRINRYTKKGLVTENEIIVLHKMSTLIDVITTFLRLSKTSELLKIMCENNIASCLIMILSKLVQENMILPGQKLLPKVLVLLGVIYKEMYQDFQGELLEEHMKILIIEKAIPVKPQVSNLLPKTKDVRELVVILCNLLDMDNSKKLSQMRVLITTEVLTAILLLLEHLTKDYENVPIILESKIIEKIFILKSIEPILSVKSAKNTRETIPIGLFTKLVFNLFESPEILGKYMERVIASVLFSKIQFHHKLSEDDAEIERLQRESAIDLDRFLNGMEFLIMRNAYKFFESCRKITILRREIKKDGEGKPIVKHTITLNKESMKILLKEASVMIPCTKVLRQKEMILTKSEHEYVTLLHEALKENKEVINTTNPEILLQILDRLIQICIKSQDGSKYVVTDAYLIDLLGQIIKIYPETLALLLTYQSSLVNGNSLISFMIQSMFPKNYSIDCTGEMSQLKQNTEWKGKVITLMKYMTYSNIHLHRLRHRVFFTEVRKQIIAEIFRVLTRNRFSKNQSDILLSSQTYSCFIILEGLLISSQNTVIFPIENKYEIIKELLIQKQEIIQLSTHIIKNLNLHSADTEILISSIISVLERITRLNKVASSVCKSEDLKEEVPSIPCTLQIYNEEYKLPGQIEIPDEPKESSTEIDDEYVEEEVIAQSKEFKIDTEAQAVKETEVRGSLIPNDSDDEGDLFNVDRPLNPFTRILDRMSDRLEREVNRQQRCVENRLEFQINTEPLDRGEVQEIRNGLGQIYQREDVKSTNAQIVDIMKGDLLGEENNPANTNLSSHNESFDRNSEDSYYDYMMYRYMRMEHRDEVMDSRQELPEISLFGETVDKQKTGELIKNQILKVFETVVVEEVNEVIPGNNEEKKSPIEAKNNTNDNTQNPEVKAQSTEEVKIDLAINEESKSIHEDNTSQVLNQRRNELAQLLPNFHINDDNILLQIDFEFLRALPPDLQQQSLEQLIAQNRPNSQLSPRNIEVNAADLDPASFLATITEESLRDEVLASANAEFLAALPPDLVNRAEHLQRRRGYERGFMRRRHHRDEPDEILREVIRREEVKRPSLDPIEPLMIVPDKDQAYKAQLMGMTFKQTCRIEENVLEALIKLLYVDYKMKIPINELFSNICSSKKHMYKLLNALLFILSQHQSYEKLLRLKLKSIESSDEATKLLNSYFPPIILYRGEKINHLTYNIVSLRAISVLSSLLTKPQAIAYFFMPREEVSQETQMLQSISQLQKDLRENTKAYTPLTVLFALIQNGAYDIDEKYLETIINFINDLLKASEYLSTKYMNNIKKLMLTVSIENVKQACQILNVAEMTEMTFNKLAEIILQFSQVDENVCIIIDELSYLIESIASIAIKEWNQEITQIYLATKYHDSDISEKEETQENTHIEKKLGRILRLLKYLYDKHSLPNEADSPSKSIRLYNSEGDAIEEPFCSNPVVPQVETDIRAHKVQDLLMGVFKKETLVDAFSVLNDLITFASNKSTTGNNSKSQLLTRLIPSIVSLILAYDYYLRDPLETSLLLSQIKEIREAKPETREGLGKKNKRAYVFFIFLENNHKAFNNLVRQMSNETFKSTIKPFILRFPNLLDFENKRVYFGYEQKHIRGDFEMERLRISISRGSIFNDSYSQLANISLNKLKGRLRVSFKDEEAADVGGVTREWYTTLSRAMFNPIIGLFKKSAHGNTYQPDPNSVIEKNHLSYFKFIGRIIGKALLDGQYLECYFTRALYKLLVGQPLTVQDLQDYDSELYSSLLWMRDNDVVDLDCTFTYTIDYFGKLEIKDLIEDGKNVKVTNENKQLFIVKMCKALLHDAIEEQVGALQKGLYEVIPKPILSIFDSKEIELLISGLPDIDLLDLKKNTEYHGYTENSKVIIWMWEVMESLSAQERAGFLQFVTGTSKVPLDGFKNLPGSSGVQRFQVHKVYADSERLPTAHTWST